MRSSTVVLSIGFLLAAAPAFATKAKKAPAPAKEAPGEEAGPADEAAAPKEETETQRAFKSIQWTKGPAKVGIDNHAEIQVPEGYAYTGGSGAQKLLELMHNPTSGTELGILTDEKLEMFLLFEFDDVGYVKDAEKEKLNADEILASLRAGNEESNKARKQRGWAPIEITGWHTAPFYNAQTNNLEWCIQGQSRGHTIVNYNTRILGRTGVLSVNLMCSADGLAKNKPAAETIMKATSFNDGKVWQQAQVQPDPSTNIPTVQVSAPIKDGGKTIGVLLVSLTAAALQ